MSVQLSDYLKDVGPKIVPNKFPTLTHPTCRLAIIGEAPGKDEEQVGEPFVGSSGKLLRAILSQCRLAPDQVLLANVCQHRPEDNDIDNFSFDGPEVQSGIAQLKRDLDTFKPNAILSLGRTPMRVLRPDLCWHDGKQYRVPISSWRGSVTESALGYKVVFCFHPAYILRSYSDLPYFKFDVARGVEQSKYSHLTLQKREGTFLPKIGQVVEFLRSLRTNRLSASLDIEGYPNDTGITCLSICPTPFTGLSIPIWYAGRNYWSDSEESIVWQELSYYLADNACLKCCHNGFYEHFVFAWKHRLLMCGINDDTMLKFWEIYPELEKNLGVVNSFCTLEPYYKDERENSDPQTHLRYNFKDSAVTDESNNNLEVELAKVPASYQHYRFNISIAPPVAYLNLRGCRLDSERLRQHLDRTTTELNELQGQIDSSLLEPALAADVLTRKRKSDPWTFNVKSTTQKQWLLYRHLGYKPSGRWGPVTDEETLLRYYAKDHNPILRLVLQAVRKRTRLQDIAKYVPDSDGRIRSTLDLVGTNTGRTSNRSSMAMRPTGDADGSWENTGTNLQNVTKDLRDVFIPDSPVYDFWQFDLRGADAWTVAADLAALGHPTMLEDMLAGIKPAKVLMALLEEYEASRDPSAINRMDRSTLKAHLDKIIIPEPGIKDAQGRPGDWKYDVCKKVQHGTNYDAKPDTIAALVFTDSDGLVDLTSREASIYQYLYKLRYKPEERNQWIRRQLCKDGAITAACGIRRKFFGIRNPFDIDDEIVRQASAFEPQANTTYCTNAALRNLWYDPENRAKSGWLHIEPLLQIHDALAGQNHSSIREWSHGKLRSYFSTKLIIHGVEVHIPADGGWGANWQDTKRKLVG